MEWCGYSHQEGCISGDSLRKELGHQTEALSFIFNR